MAWNSLVLVLIEYSHSKRKSKHKVLSIMGKIDKSKMEIIYYSWRKKKKIEWFYSTIFLPDKVDNMNEENRNLCFSVLSLSYKSSLHCIAPIYLVFTTSTKLNRLIYPAFIQSRLTFSNNGVKCLRCFLN